MIFNSTIFTTKQAWHGNHRWHLIERAWQDVHWSKVELLEGRFLILACQMKACWWKKQFLGKKKKIGTSNSQRLSHRAVSFRICLWFTEKWSTGLHCPGAQNTPKECAWTEQKLLHGFSKPSWASWLQRGESLGFPFLHVCRCCLAPLCVLAACCSLHCDRSVGMVRMQSLRLSLKSLAP